MQGECDRPLQITNLLEMQIITTLLSASDLKLLAYQTDIFISFLLYSFPFCYCDNKKNTFQKQEGDSLLQRMGYSLWLRESRSGTQEKPWRNIAY